MKWDLLHLVSFSSSLFLVECKKKHINKSASEFFCSSLSEYHVSKCLCHIYVCAFTFIVIEELESRFHKIAALLHIFQMNSVRSLPHSHHIEINERSFSLFPIHSHVHKTHKYQLFLIECGGGLCKYTSQNTSQFQMRKIKGMNRMCFCASYSAEEKNMRGECKQQNLYAYVSIYEMNISIHSFDT